MAGHLSAGHLNRIVLPHVVILYLIKLGAQPLRGCHKLMTLTKFQKQNCELVPGQMRHTPAQPVRTPHCPPNRKHLLFRAHNLLHQNGRLVGAKREENEMTRN